MIGKALLAIAFLAGAGPALGQTTKADASELARLMQAAGYQAALGKDGTGDPMITSGTSGSKFAVLFYNCTNHRDCTTIQFQAAWAMKDKPTLASINEWNRNKRFARAYLDGAGDPTIAMDVDLDQGGMSPALFRDNLDVWIAIVDAFKKHIGQ